MDNLIFYELTNIIFSENQIEIDAVIYFKSFKIYYVCDIPEHLFLLMFSWNAFNNSDKINKILLDQWKYNFQILIPSWFSVLMLIFYPGTFAKYVCRILN